MDLVIYVVTPKSALEKAGFKDFKAFIQDENEWICVTARKV